MAVGAYPTFPQMSGSTQLYVDGLVVSRSDAGNVRLSSSYPSKKKTFQLVHWLYADDLTTLESHYNDNRLLAFSFTFNLDGNSYLCVYGGVPTFDTTNSNYTQVKVTLCEQ